jgi:hypothetical protein
MNLFRSYDMGWERNGAGGGLLESVLIAASLPSKPTSYHIPSLPGKGPQNVPATLWPHVRDIASFREEGSLVNPRKNKSAGQVSYG